MPTSLDNLYDQLVAAGIARIPKFLLHHWMQLHKGSEPAMWDQLIQGWHKKLSAFGYGQDDLLVGQWRGHYVFVWGGGWLKSGKGLAAPKTV